MLNFRGILASKEGQVHRMRKQTAAVLLSLAAVLGSWKGYVALFDPGAQEPRQIFPTRVDTLPEADQTALTEGILVRSEKKLQALLEDYLS